MSSAIAKIVSLLEKMDKQLTEMGEELKRVRNAINKAKNG